MQIRFAETSASAETNPLVIESYAFGIDISNEKLRTSMGIGSIYLPKRLKEVHEGAFAYNNALKTIEIHKQNQFFEVVKTIEDDKSNVVLFKNNFLGDDVVSKDLLTYCTLSTTESYEIPANVFRISAYAFSQNSNVKSTTYLRKITIAKDNILEEIGKESFSNIRLLTSVELSSMPKLEKIEEGVFKNSFSDNETVDVADFRFQFIVFDFNNTEVIPAQMFAETTNLLGIHFINGSKLSQIGDEAFYRTGKEFTNESDSKNKDYYDKTYKNIRIGFVYYLLKYFDINLTEDGEHNHEMIQEGKALDIENTIMENYIKEYLHAFVVSDTNPLSLIGGNVLSRSIIGIYVNTENFMKTNNIVKRQIANQGFGGVKINTLDSMIYRFNDVASSSVSKIVIENCTIGAWAFQYATLTNLGIKFIDCEFDQAGDNSDSTKQFQSFQIIKTLTNNYDFEVEYNTSANYVEIKKDVFSEMSIKDSKISIIGPSRGLSLGSGLFEQTKCEEIYLKNIVTLKSTTFARAEGSGNFININSAECIKFESCQFTMTEDGNFRNLMFYELGRLNKIEFIGCANIISEYQDESSLTDESKNFRKIKTISYPETSHLNISLEGNKLTLSFNSNNM